MIMATYLTASDFDLDALGIDEALCGVLIEAVCDRVDQYTRRFFSTVEEAREYAVNYTDVVIDDLLDSETATVSYWEDDNWVAQDDVEFLPLNGSPKEVIVDVPSDVNRIQVDGTFGFSDTVPPGVKMAVRMMVVRLADRTRQAYATRRETIGEYGITYATPEELADFSFEPTERFLLDPYIKNRVG
jgi:hypothetical protein